MTNKVKNVKYREWVREWMNDKGNFVKEATYANYSIAMVNHIIPVLGDYYINEITESSIQHAVLYWLSDGRLDKKGGLSEKTVRDMLSIIKMSIYDAEKKFNITKLEYKIKFPSRINKPKPRVFSIEDQNKLVEAMYKNLSFYNVGILLCLHTGIRIGELCALQWKDIDLDQEILSITKTMQRLYIKNIEGEKITKVIISSPKSSTSVRAIPISSKILPILKDIWPGNPKLSLLTNSENYIEPRKLRNYYNKVLKDNNISHISFHGLRHTFATRCIERGADYKTVSELLGHSSINMTLNLYVHPQLEQKKKCIELI